MTWKTSKGERVLSGPEAKLFASTLAAIVEKATEKGLNGGVPLTSGPFEKLPLDQKYTVLEEVAHALLNKTASCPELSAVNESSIYYVYAWLKQEFEDTEAAEAAWGQLVLDALKTDDGAKDPPSIGCQDSDKWEAALDAVANRILWDRDFEMKTGGEDKYFQPYSGAVSKGAKARLLELLHKAAAA